MFTGLATLPVGTIGKLSMWNDEIVEEIRKTRDEYAARFNYDLAAIYKDLQEQQNCTGTRS
jgi:hypothetical protein